MDNRNLILAFVLSMAILIGFQLLLPAPKKPIPPPQDLKTAQQEQQLGAVPPQIVPGAPGAPAGVLANPAVARTRDAVLSAQQRVMIETPRVKGSIDLKGARLDDVTLVQFHETVDPASPAIVLLSPSDAAHAYFSEEGWVAGGAAVELPDAGTVWTADRQSVAVGQPVTLSWDNGEGLKFSRQIAIDADYMFTVTDRVSNAGNAPVSLKPYALMSRVGPPPASSTWISYEGPMGVFDGVGTDVKYASIAENEPVVKGTTGGWLGFSDKYWLGAVAPADQKQAFTATFRKSGTGEDQRTQIDYLGPALDAAPGSTIEHATLVFAGPKEVKLLARYRDSLGLPLFDYAVDFGWFFFLTKPIFYLLDWIYLAVGNFGLAIMGLTVCIKALFFPIQTRAVLSMNKMKLIQPEMQKLREKYGDDKARLNQEVMALYKRVGANPVAGCLPILIQIPVFFSLYKVLYVTIEMRHAPFYGWIRDLSAPDPTNIWTLFGAVPWTPPHFLPALGIWPLIYCLTMFLQQRMQPAPPDPVQAKMMQFMPLFFTFMMGGFPAGLVIYWSWNNTLTVIQQYVITRHVAKPATKLPVAAKS